MKSSRARVFNIWLQNASTLGVWRRSIRSLQPIAPLAESRARAHSEMPSAGKSVVTMSCARTQQLEAGLVADLHAAPVRSATRREGPQLGSLGKVSSAHAGHI